MGRLIKFRRMEYIPGVREITAGDLRYMYDIPIDPNVRDGAVMDPIYVIKELQRIGWVPRNKVVEDKRIEIIWTFEIDESK